MQRKEEKDLKRELIICLNEKFIKRNKHLFNHSCWKIFLERLKRHMLSLSYTSLTESHFIIFGREIYEKVTESLFLMKELN